MSISLDVKREYLNRKVCMDEARRLLRDGAVTGMSVRQLAGEIYFHAVAFYMSEKIGNFPRIRSHAETIDIDDGGDTRFRRAVYSASWRLAKLKPKRLRHKNHRRRNQKKGKNK